jgi:hypothetical protein
MKKLGVGPSSHVPNISTDDPVEDEDEIASAIVMTSIQIWFDIALVCENK